MGLANIIQSNQILTTDGSVVVRDISSPQIVLFWNITGPITGASPTIQFTLQELDPTDEITNIGQSITSNNITTISTGTLKLNAVDSPIIKISWTLTGGSPSFNGVNLSIVSKTTVDKIILSDIPIKQLYDIQSTIIYVGSSEIGSLSSDSKWLIKRVILDGSGQPTSVTWSSDTAIWDNRSSETYI